MRDYICQAHITDIQNEHCKTNKPQSFTLFSCSFMKSPILCKVTFCSGIIENICKNRSAKKLRFITDTRATQILRSNTQIWEKKFCLYAQCGSIYHINLCLGPLIFRSICTITVFFILKTKVNFQPQIFTNRPYDHILGYSGISLYWKMIWSIKIC